MGIFNTNTCMCLTYISGMHTADCTAILRHRPVINKSPGMSPGLLERIAVPWNTEFPAESGHPDLIPLAI